MIFRNIIFNLLSFCNYYFKSISIFSFHGKKIIQPGYLVKFSVEESAFLELSAQSFNYQVDYSLGYRQKEGFVISVPNVTFLGNSGAVVLRDNIVLESVFDQARLVKSPAFRMPAFLWPKQKNGFFSSITHLPWADQSNFHWFIDCLPRLLVLLPTISKPINLIIPENIPDFQRQTLNFLIAGNPSFSKVTIANNEKWKVSDYIFPSFVAGSMSGYLPAAILENMRKKIWKGYNVKSENPNKIYISRKKASKRRILNENELIPILVTAGFAIIHAEDYSYQEQVQLFYNAEYVISAHGAGLTNVLFSLNAKVLELHAQDMVRPHYFMLCKGLDFPYFYLLGSLQNKNQDFSVDLIRFEEKVNQFLQGNFIALNNT